MKIKHAKVNFADKEIQLIYNGGASFYAESIKENLSEIQNILKEFISDVKITIHSYEDMSSKDSKQTENLKQEAINHPIVKKTLQLFEGRIFNIIPKKGGNNV